MVYSRLCEKTLKYLYHNSFSNMNSSVSKMSHVTWDCTYHIVICPKYRKRRIYGQLKNKLWEILNQLLKELKIEKLEWHLCQDHIHFQLKIPPHLSISDAMWALKWKSAIRLHNQYWTRKHTTNKHFWSRGYYVRTTWLDQDMINAYIRHQEDQDKREDWNQLDLDF